MCPLRMYQLRAIAAASAALLGQGAFAQAAESTVIVLGKRASMMSAQEIKRDSIDIVDTVVADEIHKLPDLSVTDALQRITGVQIARDRGEGAAVAVRGLVQMETLLNGREVFTAGNGRTLDFADIPAEMVSSIQVYKTASAERIEGGVGGTIDLRTRRPFDFKGREIVGSARVIHGDLIKGSRSQWSVLASDRWSSASSGQFGALLNLMHQNRGWREDQKSVSAPVTRADLIPGRKVVAPGGSSETTSLGRRERDAASLVLQWRPSNALELYGDASYARFRTFQDSYQINLSATPTFVAGSAETFPGSDDIARVTWTNAPVSVLSFARDTVDRSSQLGAGARWRPNADLAVKADVSHSASFNSLFFSGPFMATSAATFSQDLSTKVPGSSVTGTDLLNPANFRYTGVGYRTLPFHGTLSTAQVDADYQLGDHFFNSVQTGLRHARRGARNTPGLIFADASISLPAVNGPAGAIQATPIGDFFGSEGVASATPYLVANLAGARDAVALRSSFGITTPIPLAAGPLSLWEIAETTEAAYVVGSFKAHRWPLDGNAGVRMVRTREAVSGSRTAPPGTPGVVPLSIDSSYTDYLPNLNLRYHVRDGLLVRAAASKTVTRPNFNQLSPSLVLVRNPITPANNEGSSGNPALRPVRSDNLDLALEHYAQGGTAMTMTAFWKRVDGFVSNVSNPETYEGVTYQVSRPQNTSGARIKGLEFGYQRFFDFLPGRWRGLGLQANYTYIDSATPNSALGTLPLQNLSKNSANVIGIYELERISARVAWNWRSKFLSGVTNVVGVGTLPLYTGDYAWLDASLSYRLNRHVTLALEGSNLLRTVRKAYYGVETRPQSAWLNDRQIGATMSVKF